jgi:cytochrome P450
VRHADVSAVWCDDVNYGVGADSIAGFDMYGWNKMMGDGEGRNRNRLAARGWFTPKASCERLEANGCVELRSAFASRRPVQVMLTVFGLPQEDEHLLRKWYDAFEKSLANDEWNLAERAHGKPIVEDVKTHLKRRLEMDRGRAEEVSLIATLADDAPERRVADDEILHHALYALALHPETFAQLARDPALIRTSPEAGVRGLSLAQAVIRYECKEMTLHGIVLKAGDLVNWVIGSANRDADVFVNHDAFDIDRADLSKRSTLATRAHTCLGPQRAGIEARISLSRIIARRSGCHVDLEAKPLSEGYELRQPGQPGLVGSQADLPYEMIVSANGR